MTDSGEGAGLVAVGLEGGIEVPNDAKIWA